MASKKDVKEFRAAVNRKFELVESRLGRIKHLLLEEQKRKIKSLEARIKNSKTPSPSSKSVDRPVTHTSSRHRMAAFACLSSSPIRRIAPRLLQPYTAIPGTCSPLPNSGALRCHLTNTSDC
jgi:hypothetical protein